MRITVFIVLIAFLLLSCKTGDADFSDQDGSLVEAVDLDLPKILERGYITAIVENSSTGLFIYRGQTMGYEYDMLKLFADSMGLQLRLKIITDIREAFKALNKGEGDIMAFNLSVTKERKKQIAFTEHHSLTRQVLVQRKPENWTTLKRHQLEAQLIRKPIDLIGKEVYVRYQSSHLARLKNLSEEIGGDILIIESFPNQETEELIRQVSTGEIDYTIADENVALVNATYHHNIDVKTPVSFQQKIAWGVRKNAPQLLESLNGWIQKMKRTTDYYVIYNKYFRSTKASARRNRSEYFTLDGQRISPYDSMIKAAADSIGWEWELLAAQIFKESKFDPQAVSWAGAVGLMQVMPHTAEGYGVTNLTDPQENLKAAILHLKRLQEMWQDLVRDPDERIKFILGSYNVGQGHLFDARKLVKKYGLDPEKWDNVAEYLMKKSLPAYYNDPVVEYGYCRGQEPVQYVKSILQTYENYKAFQSQLILEEDSVNIPTDTLLTESTDLRS
jgi:membrane-bound lytic murein transglycosylase F